jgi:hypothetical protein
MGFMNGATKRLVKTPMRNMPEQSCDEKRKNGGN